MENNEEDGKESNKKKEEEIEREYEKIGIETLYKYEDKLLMDENGSEATDLHALLELPEIYETSYQQYKETTRNKMEVFKNGIKEQFQDKEVACNKF